MRNKYTTPNIQTLKEGGRADACGLQKIIGKPTLRLLAHHWKSDGTNDAKELHMDVVEWLRKKHPQLI